MLHRKHHHDACQYRSVAPRFICSCHVVSRSDAKEDAGVTSWLSCKHDGLQLCALALIRQVQLWLFPLWR